MNLTPTFRRFKVSLPFQPYLYLLVSKENIQEVIAFLSKKYGQYITKIDQVFTNIECCRDPANTKLENVRRFTKRTWTCTII